MFLVRRAATPLPHQLQLRVASSFCHSSSYAPSFELSKPFCSPPASHLSSIIISTIIMSLPSRQLGKNGPHVTALGFGTMGLSAFYGAPKPDPERFAVLDKLYESGELFWDSADVYLDSEDLLGQSL